MTAPEHHGCDHDFDEHAVLALGEDLSDVGIMLCPAEGCQCFGTWGVGENSKRPVLPDDETIGFLRKQLQDAYRAMGD